MAWEAAPAPPTLGSSSAKRPQEDFHRRRHLGLDVRGRRLGDEVQQTAKVEVAPQQSDEGFGGDGRLWRIDLSSGVSGAPRPYQLVVDHPDADLLQSAGEFGVGARRLH